LEIGGRWIIGKDRMGAIFRWDRASLQLLDRLDPAELADPAMLIEDEEPSPISARGIGLWRDRAYITTGFHDQMVVLDLNDFRVLEIRPNICGSSPMEWSCTEHPSLHAISDKKGFLRFGSYETLDFSRVVKLDDGNIHRVRYDSRHDRFWATQDFGSGDAADIANGVVIISTAGEKLDEYLFARDDVEFVAFSPDRLWAYAGGFDGELLIFDNAEPRLQVARTVTGFSHQLSDISISDRGEVYVLCQDGEIYRFAADGTPIDRSRRPRQAVWDIQPARTSGSTLYLATDSGVSVASVSESAFGPHLSVRASVEYGHGFSRRIAATDDGWVIVTRDQFVLRAGEDGAQLWQTRLDALAHGLSVDCARGRVLAATNGGAVELDLADGRPLRGLSVDGLPIWVALYVGDGTIILISRNGVISQRDAETDAELWRLDHGEYPKRAWIRDGDLYVVGDGGLKRFEIGAGERQRWSELLSNTAENVAFVGETVCVSSYGMQIAAYDRASAELIGLLEDWPDYPKALCAVPYPPDQRYLLVAGRSGLMSLYHLNRKPADGTFTKVRDMWLAAVVPQPVLHQDTDSRLIQA
jgi:outer membrane protein assembly factor BamB